MAKTYAQLTQAIDTLKSQAEAVRQREKGGVAARIREAIAIYGLTSEDLGLSGKPIISRLATQQAVSTARAKTAPADKAKSKSTIRYRDDAGNAWSGMGPKPGWLKAALEAGRSLESLAVRDERKRALATADDNAASNGFNGPLKKSKKKMKSTVKYRDDAGHAWSGRGPKPGWIKDAMAAGKTLEQLTA